MDEYSPTYQRSRCVTAGFQQSAQRYATPQCRSYWLKVIAAPIGRGRLRPSGAANQNSSRFYLLAERRKKPQAPLRLLRMLKKYATLFCCVKTFALRYFTLRY